MDVFYKKYVKAVSREFVLFVVFCTSTPYAGKGDLGHKTVKSNVRIGAARPPFSGASAKMNSPADTRRTYDTCCVFCGKYPLSYSGAEHEVPTYRSMTNYIISFTAQFDDVEFAVYMIHEYHVPGILFFVAYIETDTAVQLCALLYGDVYACSTVVVHTTTRSAYPRPYHICPQQARGWQNPHVACVMLAIYTR